MKNLVIFIAVAVVSALVATHTQGTHLQPVPTRTVAPEVCETEGHVKQVYLDDAAAAYHVVCSDGVIVLLRR